MIFDQFSRYKACSDLLHQTDFVEGNSVLDVGSGPECLFGQFMPDAKMSYIDPLITVGSGQGRITGDVFARELDDQTFDCVSAVDVLEHVPPEHRHAFLQRVSALGRNNLILGFPTSDASEAFETDKVIDAQYRAIFGQDYSWLEEHYRFGLPSLAETIEQLKGMGWHCQAVGHGHAPWLQQLLGFVVCVWEFPHLRNMVLEISERFNHELYSCDFRPPYYRQFVIASRRPLPSMLIPKSSTNTTEAESVFQSLMDDAYQRHFSSSMSYIATSSAVCAEHDKEIVRLNAKIEEVSAWGKTLHETLEARDALVNELNAKIEEVSAWGKTLHKTLEAREAQVNELNSKIEEVSTWGNALQGALDARDVQVGELNAKIEEVSTWGNTLQGALEERDMQASGLNTRIEEVSTWGKALQVALDERVRAIVDLIQENAQWRDKAMELQQINAKQSIEIMRISDWASRINTSPIKYGTKKYAYKFARSIFRAIPLSPEVKHRLRNGFNRLNPLRPAIVSATTRPDSFQSRSIARSGSMMDQVGHRDVFVFSVIDWHFRIQRPQQLARNYAKAGKRVFFFSNHFINADEPGYQIEQLAPALPLYQIMLHVKGAPAIYFAPPTPEAEAMLQASIAMLIIDFDAEFTISLVQHAYWYPLVKRLPNTYRIYDCMDHHEGFGNVPEKLIEIEKEMLRQADLVVVTSSWLEEFARDHNANIALVRNAGEYEHFASKPSEIYVDPYNRKIIGYYGAIAEWFDLDLVRAVALRNAECLILLIGNDTAGAKAALGDLPNVVFTGEVPYAHLPFYLHAFDVCLLPFKVIPLTLATNPLKVYEYLSAGKPTVCVDLPEINQFDNLVWRARSSDEFLQQVEQALQPGGNTKDCVQKRMAFAAEQTWDHRIAELEDAISKLHMPKISVIVLTYNNLDLTKACLLSLVERTDYPNLEIIVVDNASTDDTRDFLNEFGSHHSDVNIILNRDNVGFAAGNNVGLSAATGDFLVMLNNDTVVTQGWAMTLMHHLQNDPTIGLIGPVTNNIGNEARIETRYANVADMPKEVLSYTLKHMGEIYPMRTVAFFCVMMSRQTFERCGLLDPDFGLGFFEDDDYCRRVESLGLSVACAEDVFVHHHLSASFNKLGDDHKRALFERNLEIYEAKWGKWIPHAYRYQ